MMKVFLRVVRWVVLMVVKKGDVMVVLPCSNYRRSAVRGHYYTRMHENRGATK